MAAVVFRAGGNPGKLKALEVLLLGSAIVTGVGFGGFGWLYHRNARVVVTPDSVLYTNALGRTVTIPRGDAGGLALFMLALPNSEAGKAFVFDHSRRCLIRLSRAFDIDGIAAALGVGVDHGLVVSLSRQEAKRQYPGCLSFFETYYLRLIVGATLVGISVATVLVTMLSHAS
jgi:hypothetical protein